MSSSLPSQYQLHLSNQALSKLKLKTSLNSLHTCRSVRSLASTQLPVKIRWYQRRPLFRDAYFTSLQKGSQYAAIICLIFSWIQLLFALFNMYCLFAASPGSSHFRQFGISFIFVYTGNQIVRWVLILCSLIMFALSIALIFTCLLLLHALRAEQEQNFKPFLIVVSIYIVARLAALIFEGLVNDPFYFYHQLNLMLWTFVILLDVYALLVVWSNYQELCDLTRLEDFAKEKAQSLSLSRSVQDTLNRRSSSSFYTISGRNSQSMQSPAPPQSTLDSSPSPVSRVLPTPSAVISSVTPVNQHPANNITTINTTTTTTTDRSGSSLSNQTRASLPELTSIISGSSVELARKQHLHNLYVQQQQYYAQLRRQREHERQNRTGSADDPLYGLPAHLTPSNTITSTSNQYLSVTNLPPIQRQGTPLL